MSAVLTAPALAHGTDTPAEAADVPATGSPRACNLAQLLTQTASESERERALALARSFSQRLPAALDELPRECGCLVVVKSAIAGAPNSRDLTPMLRSKVDQP